MLVMTFLVLYKCLPVSEEERMMLHVMVVQYKNIYIQGLMLIEIHMAAYNISINNGANFAQIKSQGCQIQSPHLRLMLQYVYFIYQYMYIEFHLDVPHILYNNSFYKFNNFIIFLISDQPDICKFS